MSTGYRNRIGGRRHLGSLAAALTLLLAGLVDPAPSLAGDAPAGRVAGVVRDRATGEVLPGANVRVDGTTIGAAADIEGRFSIPNAPSGPQVLVVSYIGYETQRVPTTVPDGGTVEVEILLDWEGVEGDEVLVTAQAEGQNAAIQAQLNSNTISNVVSAARIQELPDVNAAESIGRLPGVAIQRSGGEANKVAIRGLSPKYNTVTVNGVRVPSTSGDDRSVDLSLISSNMLGGVEVRKAITPDQDADAIGGSVDLKLREAPRGWMADVLAQGGYNRLQDYYGNYKFAGSASNRFFTDRLGVIVSGNLDRYDRSADKLTAGYDDANSEIPGQLTERVSLITYRTTREENVTRNRAGGSLVADYRLWDGKITANTFYNRLSSEGLYRIHDINVQSGGHNYYDMERREGATSIWTGALGLEQDLRWLYFNAAVSRTSSRRHNPEDFIWRFGQEGGVLIDEREPLREVWTAPYLSEITRVDTTIALNNVYVQETRLDENETGLQLNVQMPFQLGRRINGYVKTGGKLRWLDRMNDENQMGRGGLQYGGANNGTHPLACIDAQLPDWGIFEIVAEEGWLPMYTLFDDYTRDEFLNGEYELGLVADEQKLKQLTQALKNCENDYRSQSIVTIGRDYDGIERYQAGYLMAELNLGRHITILPGVRWEGEYSRYHGQRFREITSAFTDAPPGDLADLTTIRENDFWLPMLHLRIKPTDWFDIRLARTETITRPDYIHYAPITSIDGFRSTVRANNALLRPAQATNYDASISFYTNAIGLFTISAFSKSIDDLILPVSFKLFEDSTLTARVQSQFPGANVPQAWYDGANPTVYTYVNNPHEATYKGVEFDWQTNFWYLPSFLKGLILNANYTYITSETTYEGYYTREGEKIRNRPVKYAYVIDDTLRVGRMPDQPRHLANLTLGYDLKGFSTRLSFLYQTDRSSYVDPNVELLDAFTSGYYRIDLSARQKLGAGLEVFANLNNLNNRRDASYRGDPDNTLRPDYLEYYGFTMDLGARFRF